MDHNYAHGVCIECGVHRLAADEEEPAGCTAHLQREHDATVLDMFRSEQS